MNGTLKEVTKMDICYISVDVETTGPTPGKYDMYELGACVVGKERLRFKTNIALPPVLRYEKEALRAVGIDDIRVITDRIAPEPKAAMTKFGAWVAKVSPGMRPVFVANNAPFDWMFVAWYFEEFGIANPFGHSALDMKAYFMGLTGCPWKEATLAEMAKYAGITFKKLPHRAIDDAIIQSKIFSGLLLRIKHKTLVERKVVDPKCDPSEALGELHDGNMTNEIERPKTNCPKCGAPPEEQEVCYYYRRNDPRTYCNRCDAFVPDLNVG